MSLLKKLNAEGMTIIMVTHSEESARAAGRVLLITDGRLASKAEAVPREGVPSAGFQPQPVDKSVFMV